ncbi:MAG: peptidyl-prolyl cis-trans isomerase [Lacrimispora sp.]|nr:peptidyl-prolyl cis-trans isomerase [Lacrimispora sp.]
MNENEKDDMNTERPSDRPEDQHNTLPSDEGSVFADLRHVLGLGKKKRKSEDLVSASYPDDPIPEDSQDDAGSNLTTSELQNSSKLHEAVDEYSTEDPSLNMMLVPLDEETVIDKKPKIRNAIVVLSIVVVLAVAGIYGVPYLTEPFPPGEDVVASYNGRNVTTEELNSFIVLEQAKEREHAYCDVHGYDHSKCTPDEDCEAHPIDSLEGYRQMVTRLATEQIIQEWASSQGVMEREDVRHGIKDLLDDASVMQLMDQLHEKEITPESISSWDVQQYYDENKSIYGSKALSEVEDEIRSILVSRKDEDFFLQYIEELKQTAGLTVNFDLLRVKEPGEDEILKYYNQNSSDYQLAEKAKVLEIRLTGENAKTTATEAIRKIRSGESFDSVAATYGQDGKANTLSLEKGAGEPTIEAAVWKLQPGDVSDPVDNPDGSASILKLVSTVSAGQKTLSEVSAEIRLLLLQKNMESEYTLRKDEALFSVHSRRYTLGDFYTEFKELPPEYQAQYATYEQKQQLVEQLIAKELLLEETGDSSSGEQEKHSYDEMRIQYLAQILHQQEVDEKLSDPTEEEMQEFYNKNQQSFVSPASAQISLIWIDQGSDGEKAEQARKKADEALSLLNSGTDFSEVAKQYSEDSSASTGGEMSGALYQEYLPGQLGTEIFNLKSGETSGVIDYSYGYYIVKMRERTEEKQLTYEESKETIQAHMNEEKHSKLESEMETLLLEKADLTIYDRTLRKLLKK